jgi:hypothetical protein
LTFSDAIVHKFCFTATHTNVKNINYTATVGGLSGTAEDLEALATIKMSLENTEPAQCRCENAQATGCGCGTDGYVGETRTDEKKKKSMPLF